MAPLIHPKLNAPLSRTTPQSVQPAPTPPTSQAGETRAEASGSRPGDRPPTPKLERDPYGGMWGGYKYRSSRLEEQMPKVNSIYTAFSGPNLYGETDKFHIQTHTEDGKPVPLLKPTKGPAETLLRLDTDLPAPSVSNGSPRPGGDRPGLTIGDIRNEGNPGAVDLGKPAAHAEFYFHDHTFQPPPPSSLPSFLRFRSAPPEHDHRFYRVSAADFAGAKKASADRQAFHEKALDPSVKLTEDQEEQWSKMSHEERREFASPPKPLQFGVTVPKPPMAGQPGRFDHSYPPTKYDANGMYHTWMKKPDPGMETPPDSPVGTPTHPYVPKFHHPDPADNKYPPGPPGPPPAGGYTYPGGAGYTAPDWDQGLPKKS